MFFLFNVLFRWFYGSVTVQKVDFVLQLSLHFFYHQQELELSFGFVTSFLAFVVLAGKKENLRDDNFALP